MSQDNIAQFPAKPSDKAMQNARKWLDAKRQGSRRAADLNQAMLSSIQETFGGMGIKGIQIGDFKMSWDETPAAKPCLSDKWSLHLAQGGELYLMGISNTHYGYLGKVSADEQELDELIDVDLVKSLAPNVVIYGPGEDVPWEIISMKEGFELWITSRQELKALWANIDKWFKVAWHDDQLQGAHKLHDVSNVSITRIVKPDMDLRIARFVKMEQEFEAAYEQAAHDVIAQAEIKKAIGALVNVEDHPVLGPHMESAIKNLLPHLALAMEGKQRNAKAQKELDKLRAAMWKGINRYQVSYKDRPDAPPRL